MKRYNLMENRFRGIVAGAVRNVLREATEPEEEYYGDYDEPSPSGNDASGTTGVRTTTPTSSRGLGRTTRI